jgi:hypothetical protein
MTERSLSTVLLLLLAVVALGACGSTPQPTSPAESTTTAAGPSGTTTSQTPTTAAASTTLGVAEAGEFPSVLCCAGRGVEPGRYLLPEWLDLPLVIDVPEGWKVLNESAAKLFALARGTNSLDLPSELVAFLIASEAGTVDDVMAQLLEEPDIVASGGSSPVTVAGLVGMQQDFAVLPNPDSAGNPANDIPPGVHFISVVEQFLAPGFAWTNSTPEAHLRFVVVEVGSETLTIYLEAPPGDFDALAADVTAMLDTLADSAG